ncbi:methylmalonyl Co-A mutase-associated GTPase MeaB [Peribacillus cavernae]|uniref:Methylmalonyl Co-A mutase-associated GTPase MeaB n=1 Tax=Peribacillus cavernae TaxID=1674310 RepID=A0A433H8W9_9BACI|nr:methylmalonyl Co-A mutase-associated GTPase MeaB [Peribacillus cavernae]MDQ0220779.1 LAO/AO transport system kinase [Peribacillus cavernae]RUQ24794.1 methylmalonyl Co-A mutase-associated GTPase MeaB [Peribacillus cavernae]
MENRKKPEWADDSDQEGFASVVRKGVDSFSEAAEDGRSRFVKKGKQTISLKKIEAGLLQGERAMLARAITLIESNAPHHFEDAQQLLQSILPQAGRSIRIGISGVPGAGKSTFIEAFGTYLCKLGHKIAVLAVDPSSSVNGGSILGDKTRMEELARNPQAFIRPSPSGGTLGGVHRKTRETMLLCEAAGFDIILIETVGVGQSEAIVRSMTDFFMLLVLTGAGDELQGMKKGIMELVDAIVVNKADGDNKPLALKTKSEYSRMLHFLQPATKGWSAKAYTCSSLTGDGIGPLWDVIMRFSEETKEKGVFEERRRLQSKEWLYSLIHDSLQNMFFKNEKMKDLLPVLENQVMAGDKTVTKAVQESFEVFNQVLRNTDLNG